MTWFHFNTRISFGFLSLRFTFCNGLSQDLQRELEEALQTFRLEGNDSFPFSDIESVYSADVDVANVPLTVQYDMLSSLPNYHWDTCPHAGSGVRRSETTRVGYQTYMAFQPLREEKEHPLMLPSSARNRFIYFVVNRRSSDVRRTLRHIFSGPTDVSYQSVDPTAAPVRTRQYAHRVVKVTPQTLAESAQHVPTSSSMTLVHSGMYKSFKQKVVEGGTLYWRIHDQDQDLLAISAYSSDTGELLPQSFEHVQRLVDGNEVLYVCTCPTYGMILSMGSEALNADDVLSEDVTCMHCRFIREEIEPYVEDLFNNAADNNASRIRQKLVEAKVSIGTGVVQLNKGPCTLKFSVRSRETSTCSLVHLSDGFLACQSGECQALGLKHRRSTNRLLSLEEAASVCPHLDAMLANKEVWAGTMDENAPVEGPAESHNADDEGILREANEVIF